MLTSQSSQNFKSDIINQRSKAGHSKNRQAEAALSEAECYNLKIEINMRESVG
jgi:hypothetical protein